MYSLLVIIFLLRSETVIQAARVIGGNVSVVQGGTVVFPCVLTQSTDNLTQITWQRRTRLIKDDTNFFTILPPNRPLYFNGPDDRFLFVGHFSQRNGSLQLSNVRLSDEGTYTCIYSLFPSGNFKTEIPLTVLVPPESTVKDSFLMVGNEEVVFATCKATRSWPPADVSWNLGKLSHMFRVTNNSTQTADGTTTTVSTLLGTPTRNLHNHSVQCVIRSAALPHGTTLPLNIQIHFPPSEVLIREISKTSFECVSEANPKANLTWRRNGLPWLDPAVKVNGAVLQILNPSPKLNGLVECEANNTYGTNLGHLYLHLSPEGSSVAGWTLFGLLLSINVAVAALWIYRSDKKCSIPCLNTSRDNIERGTASEAQGPERHPLRRQTEDSPPHSPDLDQSV